MAPATAPCSRRFSDSPCSIEGTCMVFPFARHFSERNHEHPDGFRFSKLIMKTERFACYGYAFLRPGSEQNSSHLQLDCDRRICLPSRTQPTQTVTDALPSKGRH